MAAAANIPPVLSLTNVERLHASLATIQPINQCWILPTSTSVPSGRNSCTSACVCWVGGWPILLTVSSPCYTFHLLTHTEQCSSCSTIPMPTPSMHYLRAQTCLHMYSDPLPFPPHRCMDIAESIAAAASLELSKPRAIYKDRMD